MTKMQRTMTQRFLTTIAALAVFGAVGDVAAADVAAGKAKAAEVCAACHGADGNSATADFPRIGGQYGDYLAKALRDYKSGRRKNAIMAGFAQTLSKQDIENLAAYYSSEPATVSYKH
jgi:cytochrome c553